MFDPSVVRRALLGALIAGLALLLLPSQALASTTVEPPVVESSTETSGPAPEPPVEPAPTTDPVEPTAPPVTSEPVVPPVTSDPVTPTETEPPAPTSSGPAPTSGTDVPPTSSPATSTPTPTSTAAPVFYRSCAQVWAAGEPFLFAWEPGYRAGLDRDHNGRACEWDDLASRSRWDGDDRGVRGLHYRDCDQVWRDGQAFLWRWEAGYRRGLDRDGDGLACEWDDRDDHDRGRDGKDGEDGRDGRDGRDGETRTVVVYIPSRTISTVDDTDATYTQWGTVPSGSIATGAP